MKTKIFFDEEFTGLQQNTTLISIGFVSETGETFYCELVDYDFRKVDEWIRENVVAKLKYDIPPEDEDYAWSRSNHYNNANDDREGFSIDMQGDMDDLKENLTEWLGQFGDVEMWSDCLAYDWVLFNSIFGTAFDIPKNVYYIPFDICTLFKAYGLDHDVSREDFAGITDDSDKHNALWDAKVIKACFEKLGAINEIQS